MDFRELLIKDGIAEIPCEGCKDSDLLEIASGFGIVVPGARKEFVQYLLARDKGNGPVGSFSYTVGYGSFPWHTDTAYWDTPARYLLLASEEESPCATQYQDFGKLRDLVPDFDYLMSRAVFLLDVPGQKRYLSPIFKCGNKTGYRLDFHVYRPANREAETLMVTSFRELESSFHRHVWTGHSAVIIDNWRMIHAREDANNDKNRVLKRIYINELD